MEYIIREIKKEEYTKLKDFLYEAIFLPEGVTPPPKSIIMEPELQIYLTGFGETKNDTGLVAEIDGILVGAVWARIMNDYGHIDDQTPSIAISLFKEYRNAGIGTALMYEILKKLADEGFHQVSLAVQKENYALRMYQKVGFIIVDENEQEYIMRCDL